MDSKVLQVVGTIMLLGILFLAILVYSNTTGLAPVLNQIKAGVDKLVGWFIPAGYNVAIMPANISGVSVSGNVIKLSNVSATGEIATVEASGKYDGNLKLVVVFEQTGGSLSSFDVVVKSKSNATVTLEKAATGEITANIYPAAGSNFDVVLSVRLNGSNLVGTITVNTVRY
jgi:hypothetical protein